MFNLVGVKYNHKVSNFMGSKLFQKKNFMGSKDTLNVNCLDLRFGEVLESCMRI